MTAAHAALFAPVLADLEANARRYFGTAPVDLVPAEVQERPFSQLLRVRVQPEEGAASHVFVKIFKPQAGSGDLAAMQARVARDFETTRRVYDAMSPLRDLGVVRPVACYPEHLTLVTEEAAGSTLLEVLEAQAAWFPSPGTLRDLCTTLGLVGRWIRAFQASEWRDGCVPRASLVEYVDVRLQRLVQYAGADFTEYDRLRMVEHMNALCSEIPPEQFREVRIHSDLALGNVLVPAGKVVVLDFAMAGWGTRVHDLTRLSVQLDLLRCKPHVRRSVVRRLQLALVAGFDPDLSDEDPLFRLLVVLHRVNHLTTIVIKRASFPERAYNHFVRSQHVQWLAAEIARGPVARR